MTFLAFLLKDVELSSDNEGISVLRPTKSPKQMCSECYFYKYINSTANTDYSTGKKLRIFLNLSNLILNTHNILVFIFFLLIPWQLALGRCRRPICFCSICVHHAANLRLRRLAEPIPLQAWPPVFHIKAEASR